MNSFTFTPVANVVEVLRAMQSREIASCKH
jgi:hypothetical protein